jgi:hypothetical protein
VRSQWLLLILPLLTGSTGIAKKRYKYQDQQRLSLPREAGWQAYTCHRHAFESRRGQLAGRL